MCIRDSFTTVLAEKTEHVMKPRRRYRDPESNTTALVFPRLDITLEQLCERQNTAVWGIDLSIVREVGRQLLGVLETAKDAGIIHGDIKPANVMLTETRQQIKVTDWGSALSVYEAAEINNVSAQHRCTHNFCSIDYRAPELIHGGKITPAMDVWSAGLILVEMAMACAPPLFGAAEVQTPEEVFVKQAQLLGVPHGHVYAPDQTSCLGGVFSTNEWGGAVYTSSTGQVVERPTTSLHEFIGSANPLFMDLCFGLLDMDPEKRLTAAAALKHPFFTN